MGCIDRPPAWTRADVLAACVLLLLSTGVGSQDQKQPPFRSLTTLVPIDVRVVDRNGKPVRDLTRDDFSVDENGVPQTISVFERWDYQKRQATPDLPLAVQPSTPTARLRPEGGRVFLIVFGQLWLTSEVFGTAEAITAFVRERLLPQDYAAVSAWGRATTLTTDHEYVAQVVERLRRYQNGIDRDPDRTRKTRALQSYASKPLSPEIQAELDTVFAGHGRTISQTAVRPVHNLVEQIGRQVTTLEARQGGLRMGPSALAQSSTRRVLEIASGIQYLRYVEGEKHLVYVSPNGLWLPAVEDDHSIARIASDARVALHILQTGGIQVFDQFGRPAVTPGAGGGSLFARMASEHVAELTGGQAWFSEYPARALTQLDAITRTGYSLGYYPSNSTLDGRHRKISVTLKRERGATLSFRRSYLAQTPETIYDHRQFIVQDRILAAGEADGEKGDIKLTLDASVVTGAVAITVRIDTDALPSQPASTGVSPKLHVAFFCTDERGSLSGQTWQTLDLSARREASKQDKGYELTHVVRVPVVGRARSCKAVAYNYESDRVGSAVVRLK